MSSTTGQNIAKTACDVVMRLGLPLSKGQTYGKMAALKKNKKILQELANNILSA
ncbi:hypothetical protein ACUOGS_24330 [Escherichia coli]